MLLSFLLLAKGVLAQDLEYARETLDQLCSDELAGRGYVEDGDNAAAYYIEQEFKRFDLRAWDFNYYQQFIVPVNTFPGKVELSVGEKRLIAGADFHVEAGAPGIQGTYGLTHVSTLPRIAPSGRVVDSTASYSGFVVLADSLLASLPPPIKVALLKGFRKAGAKGIIRLTDSKLTWSVSQQQAPLAQFVVKQAVWDTSAISVSVDLEATFRKRHRTQNVIAFVPGSEQPDKFIVFTAHYDHLGKMGKDVIFRGANDNASGTALLLNLAKHYSLPENQPECSIMFMAFAGEELGLLGSDHYVQNPLFPLEDIVFLINLDINGTGDEGVTVVNGTVHAEEFARLQRINEREMYLTKVKERGKAAISDHHPFTEAGVPCFYLYTLGGIKAYHDIYDVPETLPLTEFEDLFRLLTDFVATF